MSKVAIVRCESYEIGEVTRAVERGINLIGGISSFVSQGEKILLKPNWLATSSPEKCAVTHPAVFEAVAQIFKTAGAVLSYGDSPAFQSPEAVAKVAGFTAPAAKLGIELADFRSGEDVVYESARQNKQFNIAKGALACDGMVSIPKLKTHGFLKLTGAVKNQFGCIPGIQKAEFHLKLTSSLDFAKMLVDLTALLKPRLYVMDGIIAMEGNGPMGGTPRKLGVLLLSADPIALDATVCRMLCVKPELSHTISIGKEFGLGTYLEHEIEIAGDPIPVTFADFNVNRGPIPEYRMTGGMPKFFTNIFVPRPFIVQEKCIKCGDCVAICPPKPRALDWHDGDTTKVPTYDYDKCIRCYCCQEICSRGAIELKVPLVRKLSGGIHRAHGRRIGKK